MTEIFSKSELHKYTKTQLLSITKKIGIKNVSNKKKDDIIDIILSHEDPSEKYKTIKINNNNYTFIYHLSDIHIRPLYRHSEYNEVFENVYTFLKNKCNEKNKIIIAITGDILHEKDNLKPETVLLCRNFIKNLSKYGDVVIITGNHDMLENNTDRIDNLTAIVDDLPIYYLVNSGAYQFGNIILVVSSLVDKKFIRRTQVINPDNLTTIALYHGTINGSVNDVGYIIEDTSSYSTRFRKISDFDGYDLVLLGDIHKHQYLKPHIAYPSSLIQQNFGENLLEHGLLEWNIEKKNSIFYPIKNRYGFISIYVENNIWKLPNNIPEKPYIRLLLKNTDNDQVEKIKKELDMLFDLQSFKTKEITEDISINDLLPDEIKSHQDDIDILNEEMDILEFTEERKKQIFDIHRILKEQCFDENINYGMNNQNWKILKLSFKNVFIFGENKTNIIDFTKLHGITSIIGPNAIGKSNIINIIIFLLYGSNVNFKVPHILNKYQNEYFIECEILFGAKKYKIKKTGKKRKGNKLNHQFSLYIYDDKWIKQDKENNKETSKILKSLLGTVNEFLLTNVYSNSSLRTILTLTNSEKHKALSKLFSLDIYENLEKIAKKDLFEIKKQCTYLEGQKKGLLYSYDEDNIKILEKAINILLKENSTKKSELQNLEDKKIYLQKEKSNILLQKEKDVSNVKILEEKNFKIIREECKKYELDYKNIIDKPDINITELKSNYYRLDGSIIKISKPDNTNIDYYINKKNELDKKYEFNINIINELQKEKENIQVVLNTINRKIVDLSDICVNDKSEKINILEKKHKNVENCSIEDVHKKIIKLKSQILQFKPTYKPDVLPKEYDNIKNKELIHTIKTKIQKNKDRIIKNNEHIISNKPFKIEKIEIHGNTLKDKETFFIYQNEKLHTQIKIIKPLPKIENMTIEMIENKITILKNNFISDNTIQDRINILNTLEYKNSDLLLIKNEIKNTIQFLEKIKNSIHNQNTIHIYNELYNLNNYKNIYYENIKIKKNNKKIQNTIKNLEYHYYLEVNSILEKNNILYEKELEKHITLDYSYNYYLYDKCCNLENYIEYKNCIKEQEEFIKFITQKEKNNILIKECTDNENRLLTIKEKIISYQDIIKTIKNDIEKTNTIIKTIKIYNKNNDISKKMSEIQKNIDDQIIRDRYNNLKDILKDESTYNIIKNKNKILECNIKKYEELIHKIENELVFINDTYVSLKLSILSIEKEIVLKKSELYTLEEIKKSKDNINTQIIELEKDIEIYEDYINLVNKNNIPVKLINKKNSYIRDHINIFLEKLTKFTISIDTDSKNGICFNVQKNGLILDIDQLSGYETFILNIGLKSALNKYSFTSKSTLFILDEGLDVVDKSNFKNLKLLMKLLMKHYKHILLISHMPKVKDLQNNEIIIENNGISSYIL